MPGANVVQSPLQSLAPGTTAGAGTVLDNSQAKADHSLIVVIAGTLTAGMVTLETSADNQNWSSVPANGGAANLPAGFATGSGVWAVSLVDFPAQFVRAAVTTTITGGTVTAYVASA